MELRDIDALQHLQCIQEPDVFVLVKQGTSRPEHMSTRKETNNIINS